MKLKKILLATLPEEKEELLEYRAKLKVVLKEAKSDYEYEKSHLEINYESDYVLSEIVERAFDTIFWAGEEQRLREEDTAKAKKKVKKLKAELARVDEALSAMGVTAEEVKAHWQAHKEAIEQDKKNRPLTGLFSVLLKKQSEETAAEDEISEAEVVELLDEFDQEAKQVEAEILAELEEDLVEVEKLADDGENTLKKTKTID